MLFSDFLNERYMIKDGELANIESEFQKSLKKFKITNFELIKCSPKDKKREYRLVITIDDCGDNEKNIEILKNIRETINKKINELRMGLEYLRVKHDYRNDGTTDRINIYFRKRWK